MKGIGLVSNYISFFLLFFFYLANIFQLLEAHIWDQNCSKQLIDASMFYIYRTLASFSLFFPFVVSLPYWNCYLQLLSLSVFIDCFTCGQEYSSLQTQSIYTENIVINLLAKEYLYSLFSLIKEELTQTMWGEKDYNYAT